MKYKKLTGIILKKQNYREADQIVSIWTEEAGKIRCLAKSLRKPTSKLAFCMSDLSEVEINLAGNQLPTLIGARVIRQFKTLQEDLEKTAIAFYVAELMLKMTADEHPNIQAYQLLSDFLKRLDQGAQFPSHRLADKFALNLAQTLGFGSPRKSDTHRETREFIESLIERKIKSEAFLLTLS